jgi:hypothetical protein
VFFLRALGVSAAFPLVKEELGIGTDLRIARYKSGYIGGVPQSTGPGCSYRSGTLFRRPFASAQRRSHGVLPTVISFPIILAPFGVLSRVRTIPSSTDILLLSMEEFLASVLAPILALADLDDGLPVGFFCESVLRGVWSAADRGFGGFSEEDVTCETPRMTALTAFLF